MDLTYLIIFLVMIPVFGGLIHLLRAARGLQKIYELSPSQHQSKVGTVSMGGIGIVVGILGAGGYFLWGQFSREVAFSLVTLASFGGIGFWDDLMSIKRDKNKGLSARDKFLLQTALAAIIVAGFHVWVRPLPVWEMGLYLLMFNGVSNATNLTDGLDGLLGGLSVITLIGFLVLFSVVGPPNMVPLVLSGISVLCAFLVFNLNPAKVFMGDTGSLALGAWFVSLALILDNPWVLLGLGAIYLIETLSVIIQVGSFKLRGVRVFRMAPLHHHFELVGLNEWQVVTLFWSAGLIAVGGTLWILI